MLQGDLDAPLPASLRGTVDVLVANAPYVPTEAVATMPPEARDHERRVALDGGVDGLDVTRRVVACAPTWLRPGGHLVIETSLRQAPALVAAYRGNQGDGTFDHAYNWWDPTGLCTADGGAPCDPVGHGTHTMGTMVGDGGQGAQIGVAPGARWIAAKGCEQLGCSEQRRV